MKKIKILHVISSLEMGGAEITLSKLLLHRDASFEEGVVVLRKIGSIGQQLQLKGIKIYNLKNAS